MALWGAGFCPLHPPRLNLSGTGYPCRWGVRRGAGRLAPLRHWLSLPLWYPAGGVAVLVARLPFTLALFLPPSPAPLPSGKGETQSFLMQGASPLASPGLNPRGTYRTCQAGARSGALPLAGRGWVAFRYPAGAWGLAPCGTCYPCPGGEDHLKRRSSSPPVPPLLGCRRCS